ncbi:hypothetical protein O9H85_30730 [Paenibacillus filicis]|uniref:SnoaL-like domain-containing protein n=1 Tax=Paenibacillus gyeongsangnamensis TaxID=3388067 RepID=A0ABT4QIS2_9BACL|nr:hypothetical protein [Paenibacillus filicis]MCZ8516682.1 hypothetical protein [Paenibacillus filicis]
MQKKLHVMACLGLSALLFAGFTTNNVTKASPKNSVATSNADQALIKTSSQESKGQEKSVFPEIADTTHATKEVASIFHSFFTAKTMRDVNATMSHFDPDNMVYYDATLGWPFLSFNALKSTLEQYMPTWANGKSYPTRILGDSNSAIVFFTDTPELFGNEIRIMGSVNFKEGKIVRWVDYWDGRTWPMGDLAKNQTPADKFPETLGEDTVEETASTVMRKVANKLNESFANNDAAAAADLFSYDAVFEDMLRANIQGQLAISRYLKRALKDLPYGSGASVRHVLGSDLGGGYEWRSDSRPVPRGNIALELDADGKITRLTSIWDGSLLSDDAMASLVNLSIEE